LLNLTYKPPAGTVFEPRGIKIEGNIFIQFILHLCGLLFASLVFIIELRSKITVCLKFVCGVCDLMVKKCLIQCQKVSLVWVKSLFAAKDKLLH